MQTKEIADYCAIRFIHTFLWRNAPDKNGRSNCRILPNTSWITEYKHLIENKAHIRIQKGEIHILGE